MMDSTKFKLTKKCIKKIKNKNISKLKLLPIENDLKLTNLSSITFKSLLEKEEKKYDLIKKDTKKFNQ